MTQAGPCLEFCRGGGTRVQSVMYQEGGLRCREKIFRALPTVKEENRGSGHGPPCPPASRERALPLKQKKKCSTFWLNSCPLISYSTLMVISKISNRARQQYKKKNVLRNYRSLLEIRQVSNLSTSLVGIYFNLGSFQFIFK